MCDSCDFEDLLEKIDALLGDEDYEWASDTLSGIADWVEGHKHATDNQWQAVENIEAKGEK